MVLNSSMLLVFILMFISVVGGFGIYSHLKMYITKKPYSFFEIKETLVTSIAIGFATIYSLYCLAYFLEVILPFENIFTLNILVLAILSVVGCSLLIFNIYKANKNIYNLKKSFSFFGFFIVFVSVFILLPQIILGNTPTIVNDTWSHISIINRFIYENDFVLSSYSMPNDNYLLKYSSHHAFLSAIAVLSGASALEVYAVASAFYSIVATAAFLLVLTKFLKNDESYLVIFISLFIFINIFAGTNMIWRGDAGYRIPAFIMMFILLSTIYPKIAPNFEINNFHWVKIALFSIATGVTHAYEIALLTLMLMPYGAVVAFKNKSKKILIYLFKILIIFAFSSILGYIISKTANFHFEQTMEYKGFLTYYINGLKTHITLFTWLVAVFLTVFYKFIIPKDKNNSALLFFNITLISSIVLGALNPLLFPIYKILLGATHANRLMYVFPFYLIFAYFTSYILISLKEKLSKPRRVFLILVLLIILLSILNTFYEKMGLNGKFRYGGNDKYSQIYIYDDFYKKIQKFENKIIISDTYISAPINAISNNFVFTHRPWTGGVNGRFSIAQKIMINPLDKESIKNICEYKIDLIAINNAVIPTQEYIKAIDEAPWVMKIFSLENRIELKKAFEDLDDDRFEFLGNFNGIKLFNINREKMCVN